VMDGGCRKFDCAIKQNLWREATPIGWLAFGATVVPGRLVGLAN